MYNEKIKAKCLLVDDLEENLIALEALLNELPNIDIVKASSGKEALELLLIHDFALALIDVQMPEMSGFELAEYILSTEKTKTVPIIFVTAAGNDTQREFKGYEAGAVDFLHKPISKNIVLSKVKIFLDLYRQKISLKQKLERIKIAENDLQRALRSRDDFLSICSHELKTPLTTLKMQTQITERMRKRYGDEITFSPENMSKFMQHTESCIERLIYLVNDMLDISRISTGQMSLNLENVNFKKLVEAVVDRLKNLIHLSNCNVSISSDEEIVIRADGLRLEQVITNILTNATKYAPHSKIEIELNKTNGYGHLRIKDFGPGISEQDQLRIFERFERATSPGVINGLGLGLYISKEIVQMHQGEISVESKVGHGSSFSVAIPLSDIQ